MLSKCTYFFGHTYRKNFRVNRTWAGVAEAKVTYHEMIRDILQVKLKHEEMSFGDFRVSKQVFQFLKKKLTQCLSHKIKSTEQVSGRGDPLTVVSRALYY